MTAQGAAGDTKAPAWTKTASDEAARVQQGNQAASLISSALQNMGWGASPWAQISSAVMRPRPHKAADAAYVALRQRAADEGGLKLAHFRRVKQLGAGDVGLVDLVQLQVSGAAGGLARAVQCRCCSLAGCCMPVTCAQVWRMRQMQAAGAADAVAPRASTPQNASTSHLVLTTAAAAADTTNRRRRTHCRARTSSLP